MNILTLKTHRVVVGIGRSGNFRTLGVPGEDLDLPEEAAAQVSHQNENPGP